MRTKLRSFGVFMLIFTAQNIRSKLKIYYLNSTLKICSQLQKYVLNPQNMFSTPKMCSLTLSLSILLAV